MLSSVLGPLSADAVAAITLCPDSGTSISKTSDVEPQVGEVNAPTKKEGAVESACLLSGKRVSKFRGRGSWLLFVLYFSESFS